MAAKKPLILSPFDALTHGDGRCVRKVSMGYGNYVKTLPVGIQLRLLRNYLREGVSIERGEANQLLRICILQLDQVNRYQ